MRRVAALFLLLAACSRPAQGTGTATGAGTAAGTGTGAGAGAGTAAGAGAGGCADAIAKLPPGSDCRVFASPEDAFRHVLATNPRILAVGEAHAQKGTEHLASTTRRFTETLLPIVAPRASDVVVELWAPDARCMKEVAKVDTAQKQVTTVQAATNKNEYETLGFKAKELGVTPWLLRPSCDEFASLADAGDGAVTAMLDLVRRLTTKKVRELLTRPTDGGPRTVLAYGGLMHNDLAPPPSTKDFAFGPDLAADAPYTELDLIVPEYVKDAPTWQALPWSAAWPSIAAELARSDDGGARARPTHLLRLGARSFVLVFPPSS